MEEEQLRKIIREMLEQSLNETQGVPDFLIEYSNILSEIIMNFVSHANKNFKSDRKQINVNLGKEKVDVDQIITELPDILVKSFLKKISTLPTYRQLPLSIDSKTINFKLSINTQVDNKLKKNSVFASINNKNMSIGNDDKVRGINLEIHMLFKDKNINRGDFNELRNKIYHEFTHAFEEYNRLLSKKSSTNVNRTLRGVAGELLSNPINSSNNIWKNFIYLFYINSPEEINARVSEFYSELSKKTIPNKEELLSQIRQTSAFSDYLSLKNFNANDFYQNFISETSKKDVDNRIMEFYSVLKFIENNETKVIAKHIDRGLKGLDFFLFFEKEFKSTSEKFIKKLNKTAYYLFKNKSDKLMSERFESFMFWGFSV